MAKKRKALLSGLTGQDGSYIAELLLEKGYDVYGIKRRTAHESTGRIKHLIDQELITILDGDLSDSASIAEAVRTVLPDEVYNLGAQSFVKTSFSQPEVTSDVTGLGALRFLEAIRMFRPKARFYQASSSEMFGSCPPPQNEKSLFHPRSPYGVAKMFAYWMTVNYRERGLFACNGVLFNHETVTSYTPVIYKVGKDGEPDIAPISEVVNKYATIDGSPIVDESKRQYQQGEVTNDLYIWDDSDWTKVKYASGYPHEPDRDNKRPRLINARHGCFSATSSHVVIMDDGEKDVGSIKVGDKISTVDLPSFAGTDEISESQAKLLGFLAGDGHIDRRDKSRFINSNPVLREHVFDLWKQVGGERVNYYPSRSGFNTEKTVGYIDLHGKQTSIRRRNIYNDDGTKRVPVEILRGSLEIKRAFLEGYYEADGLKAGYGTYKYKHFKTNSPTLALGLLVLIQEVTGQDFNITVEERRGDNDEQRLYYSVNLLSDANAGYNVRNKPAKVDAVVGLGYSGFSQRAIHRETGLSRGFIRKVQRGDLIPYEHHMAKPKKEVKKIIDLDYDGWFYDLETESGTFHCGVGKSRVHNSPRRGIEFVTQKIAHGVASIKRGEQDKLYLGNLDAMRDWGHAKDYVEAMWLMLQQKKPDDYVIATGEAHSVREFCDVAFSHVGLNYEDYVEVDPRFFRPTEVDYLMGDITKARKKLGWEPKTGFEDLVKDMVDAAMRGTFCPVIAGASDE